MKRPTFLLPLLLLMAACGSASLPECYLHLNACIEACGEPSADPGSDWEACALACGGVFDECIDSVPQEQRDDLAVCVPMPAGVQRTACIEDWEAKWGQSLEGLAY
jgi:hypothetical protein